MIATGKSDVIIFPDCGIDGSCRVGKSQGSSFVRHVEFQFEQRKIAARTVTEIEIPRFCVD